jgi:hypothetical protein
MKKALLVLICIACVGQARAQSIDVSANFGVLTAKDFKFNPLTLSGNVVLDISVGSYIMISPECTLYGNSKLQSASLVLAPGGTINFTTGQIFLGAGIVKEFWLKQTDISVPLEMKLQIGVRASKYRLGAYMLTFFDEMFTDMAFGFTLGFAM